MTRKQKENRFRQVANRRATLEAELRTLNSEARALENELSWAMGYLVPLRGKMLLDHMQREQERAA